MPTTQAINATLPLEMAQMIKSKVASGEYASDSDVVRDGLNALFARDKAVEEWLTTEGVAAFDETVNHPESVVHSQDARAILTAHTSNGSRRIHDL